MKKFRLKKEATPFFKDSLANCICDLNEWNDLKVDINALEEVEPVHITYGHRTNSGSWLSGWNKMGLIFILQ